MYYYSRGTNSNHFYTNISYDFQKTFKRERNVIRFSFSAQNKTQGSYHYKICLVLDQIEWCCCPLISFLSLKKCV